MAESSMASPMADTASGSAHLLTLALATLAGWAALTALVVYAGLGGRYTLHPDDPSLAAALPEVNLARAETRLGPYDDYAVIGARPLFNADRLPLPDEAETGTEGEAEEEAAQPLDVTLTSVVLTKDVGIALLTDNKTKETQSVRVGGTLEGEQSGWKLAQLEPRRAIFEGPTGRTEVELRVFDGSGGQSPTPMGRTDETAGEGEAKPAEEPEEMTPETRAEMIRARIEERRRQMREEAERANQEGG